MIAMWLPLVDEFRKVDWKKVAMDLDGLKLAMPLDWV